MFSTAVEMVFGQGAGFDGEDDPPALPTIYPVRERRYLWSSMPSWWMLGGAAADIAVVTVLATQGF